MGIARAKKVKNVNAVLPTVRISSVGQMEKPLERECLERVGESPAIAVQYTLVQGSHCTIVRENCEFFMTKLHCLLGTALASQA